MSDVKYRVEATQRRCPQCWKYRDLDDFRSKVDRRRVVNWCIHCRNHYSGDNPKPRSWRGGPEDEAELRVRVIYNSRNRKTGPIVTTMTSPCTCPTSCPWYGNGCYSEYHVLSLKWRDTPEDGLGWDEFCDAVGKFERGALWRHNVAGDLPGVNAAIDAKKLFQLVEATAHTRGFTYTHKPLTRANRDIIRRVNSMPGLAINLSADGLEQADLYAAEGIGPVVVVLPADAPRHQKTRAGRKVAICPAQARSLTCLDCGLCYVKHRKTIIGFRAHGCAATRVSQRVGQLSLPFSGETG